MKTRGGGGGGSVADRPNVVVIVADTFRRDHLGAYGNPYIRTPHLDGFARSSVVFDNHVVSSFPTMPARADILTGTFSYAHMGWEPLPRHLMTLPQVLSKAGYLTMGIVDTPFFVRNGFGYDRGFDDFVWIRGQGDDTRPHERHDISFPPGSSVRSAGSLPYRIPGMVSTRVSGRSLGGLKASTAPLASTRSLICSPSSSRSYVNNHS
ncbi:MAG: sulfatase-like hydrolase/transferase [Actinomycetota bacterium]|nr:sulfatase-like hydrolase/transferase [Actinomycetota bacterium]